MTNGVEALLKTASQSDAGRSSSTERGAPRFRGNIIDPIGDAAVLSRLAVDAFNKSLRASLKVTDNA